MATRATALFALTVCALAACGSMHKVRSSLYTPCRAKEIAISQESYAGGEETWIATCRGRDYACSAIAVGNKVNYRCRPLPAQATDAGPTDAATTAVHATVDALDAALGQDTFDAGSALPAADATASPSADTFDAAY